MGFRFSFSWTNIDSVFPRYLGGNIGLVFPGQVILLAPIFARSFPAAPLGAPTQTACGVFIFSISQVLNWSSEDSG